jgi:hypothetical protein
METLAGAACRAADEGSRNISACCGRDTKVVYDEEGYMTEQGVGGRLLKSILRYGVEGGLLGGFAPVGKSALPLQYVGRQLAGH